MVQRLIVAKINVKCRRQKKIRCGDDFKGGESGSAQTEIDIHRQKLLNFKLMVIRDIQMKTTVFTRLWIKKVLLKVIDLSASIAIKTKDYRVDSSFLFCKLSEETSP